MANRPLPNDGNQPPSYADTVKDEQSMNVPMAQPPLSKKRYKKLPQVAQVVLFLYIIHPPISQQPIAGVGGPNPTTQSGIPQQLTWMPLPAPNTVSNDCPTGLERLSQISQVIISPDIGKSEHKDFIVSHFSRFTIKHGLKTPINLTPRWRYIYDCRTVIFMPTFQNKYQVKNNAGQLIYYAAEDNTITMDIMSWKAYNLAEIGLYDSNERKVIQLSRVLTGEVAGCFGANYFKIHIASPPEVMIGKIIQTSACGPKHAVTSPNGIIELALNGPGHCCATPLEEGSLSFQIISKSGTEIGSIGKYFPTMERYQ
ncbi:Phospholipid scramblase 2, partial [Trichoplax sp. H2]